MRNDDNQNDKNGPVSKALALISYPAAAYAGYKRGASTLYSFAYNSAKDSGALNDIRGMAGEFTPPEVDEKVGGVFAEYRKVGRKALESITKEGKSVPFTKESKKVFDTYDAALNKRMEMLELKTMPQQWEKIMDHQRWQVGMNAAETAAITLGSLLFLSQTQSISRLFNHGDKGQDKGNSR